MATTRVELVRAIAVQLRRTSRAADTVSVAEVIDGSERVARLVDAVYKTEPSRRQWQHLLRDVARFWED